MIFIDEINKYNPTPHVARLNTVNLCGEQPLLSYEACNLGSINLAAHVKPLKGRQSTIGDYDWDWKKLEESVRIGVRMLDNVVSVCAYPLPQIDAVVKANRKIGLGVMGWADALVKLGIAYNAKAAFTLAEKVMDFVNKTAWDESKKLGKEKGSFPNFKGSIWEKRGYKHFRNATTTTIAPTGSLSLVAGASSGIEPIFALAFYRKAMGGYELPELNQDLLMALKRAKNGVFSNELVNAVAKAGSVQELESVPEKIREVFVTAMDISPEDHVKMQAAFQKHTDNAVSKTINLPSNSSVEDVMDAFVAAWKTKCKGITVYRDKSREIQILNIGKSEIRNPKSEIKARTIQKPSYVAAARPVAPTLTHSSAEGCPNCGGKVMMVEGCETCASCGWGACSV